MKYITSKELQNATIPGPDMLLLEKDFLGKMTASGIALTNNYSRNATRNAGSAVVKKVSPFISKDSYATYLLGIIKPGDRVGVNPTTPLVSPCMPDQSIKNEDGTEDRTFLIHVEDVLCFLPQTEEEKNKLMTRIEREPFRRGTPYGN